MYLVQGQRNSPDLLNFHVVDRRGFLADPTEIAYRITDEDGNVVVAWTDVKTTGRKTRGWFYAAEAQDVGWLVPAIQAAGLYHIDWAWELNGVIGGWSEPFHIESTADGLKGLPFRTYVTPTMARDEGVDVARVPDVKFERLLRRIQSYIDRICQQPFVKVWGEHRSVGGNSMLLLARPVVGVYDIRVADGDDGTVVENTGMAVRFVRCDGSNQFMTDMDHRRNPKIEFESSSGFYAASGGRFSNKFQYIVTGAFGFVEPDGCVPEAIQDAMLQLLYVNAIDAAAAGEQILDPPPAGPLVGETIDRHTKRWAQPSLTQNIGPRRSLLSSRKIEELLYAYRRPIAGG